MKTNHLVSVVVPCYNASKYLKQSLLSVLSQTYNNLEIIVVDDGSIDESSIVVKKLQSEYTNFIIKYIYQKNKGPAAARNQGISLACGDYIAILDSDDIWHPKKLELQVEKIKNPDKDIVFSSIIRFCGEFGTAKYFNQTNPPVFTTHDDYFESVLNLSNTQMANFFSILIPKSFFSNNLGYDESLITAEDWDLWLRIASMKQYNIININEPLVYYRKYEQSLTRKFNTIKTLKNQIKITYKHTNKLKMSIVKSSLLNKFQYFFSNAIYNNNYEDARIILQLYISNNLLHDVLGIVFFLKFIVRYAYCYVRFKL